jgi:putative DNA primase/helicase
MDKTDCLKEYRGRGWKLVRLRPGSKKPYERAWQHDDCDPGAFTEADNFGVVLGEASGGIVDVDLDQPEAVVAAGFLLPPTGVVFGRPSNPSSHRLYRVAEPGKTARFKDGNGRVVVEYRANNSLTMAPPSVHPDSEKVAFEEFGDLGSTARADLLERCRSITAVVEVARHYRHSNRHDIALAFSGVLLRQGFDRAVVRACIEALCAITRDEEPEDRLRAVEDTVARHARGEAISGLDALREAIGEPAARHVGRLLGASINPRKAPPAAPVGHDLNDAGNGDRLIRYAQGNLAYVPETNTFLHYRYNRWQRDEGNLQVRTLAERAIREELERLGASPAGRAEFRDREARLHFLERSLNDRAIRAMLEMVKPRIAVPLAKLDADDNLIGVQNGVFDLQRLKLRENSRDDYITLRANVSFEPNANCPRFDAFLTETFGDNPPLIAYVTGLFGSFLSGHLRQQEFYVLVGPSATGKSTFVRVLQSLMGDYARTILSSTLFEGHLGEKGDYDLAGLPGVRLAVAQEAESRFRLHGPRLKQMTGGDIIAARPIYAAPITFVPKAKILIVTNREPEADVYDGALRRRVRIIRCDRVVPEGRRDPQLLDKLLRESAGIFNRLVRAGADFAAGKIPVPDTVTGSTERYLSAKDHVGAFLEEHTEAAPEASVPKKQLHDTFKTWCQSECVPSMGYREFNLVMQRKGFEDHRTSSVRGWKNLRLRDAGTGDC